MNAATICFVGRKRGTGLTDEQAKALAKRLEPYFENYDRNQTSMAKAWGVSQSQLSQILSGKGRGAGVAVLVRIRQHTGLTLDELLGLAETSPVVDAGVERVVSAVEKAISEIAKERRPLGPSSARQPSR